MNNSQFGYDINSSKNTKHIKFQIYKKLSLFFLLSVILISFIIYAYYKTELKSELLALEIHEKYDMEEMAELITREIQHIARDLLFIARSTTHFNISEFNEDNFKNLSNIFQNLIITKNAYDQIRIIDSDGREIIRVNKKDGKTEIIKDNKFQNKKKRYYFNDILKLNKNEIYISPLDLNIENGLIEIPYKPMLRLGTPIFDKTGNKTGIVIVNYLGNILFKTIKKSLQHIEGHFSLLNSNSYWLIAPDKRDEWGFMFPKKKDINFKTKFPKEWSTIQSTLKGQFYSANGIFTYSTSQPLLGHRIFINSKKKTFISSLKKFEHGNYEWKIVFHIPAKDLILIKSNLKISKSQLWIVLFLINILVFFYLIRINISKKLSIQASLMYEKQYQYLFEQAREGILISRDNRILMSNRYLAEILKYTIPELKSMNFYKLFHEEDLNKTVDLLNSINKENSYDNKLELRFITKENNIIWIELHSNLIDWFNDVAMLHFFVDITKRKSAELDLIKMNTHLKKIVQYDELTNLFNRRQLNYILKKEFSRAARYGSELSCLLFDIDFFKHINDTFGHPFGDFVLKELAQYLKKEVRESDYIFRYGGEEFLILLPNTDVDAALSVAEKLRSVWEKKILKEDNKSTTTTISIGITSRIPHKIKSWSELLSNADNAMYSAKVSGRNRVEIYTKPVFHIDELNSKQEINIKFLRDKISKILEKTKKASIDSITLLAREMGGTTFQKHNQMVCNNIKLISDHINLPDNIIDTFKRASSLHNCFKIMIKNELEKTKLNDEQKIKIKSHPYMLAELMELFDFFSHEKSVLLNHHENYDGSGYPEGLKGDQIPIGARIFAISDAFSAMQSDRPHRKKLKPLEIIDEFVNNAGTQFDPMLTIIFMNVIMNNKLLDVPEDVLQNKINKIETFIKNNKD